MCKHKSGGMNNTSSTSQSGLPDRTAAPFSSHNCPQDSNGASNSQAPSSMEMSNSNPPYTQQVRNYAAVPAALQQPVESAGCNSSCNTHTFLSNDESINIPCQKYEKITFIPNVQEAAGHEYFESPESEDDDTEQSPMLMKEACGMYCTPMESWNPNILSEAEFNKDILKPKHFGACDVYPCTDVTQHGEVTCDNYPLYHQIQNTFQEPVSYLPPSYNNGMSCSTYFSNSLGEYDSSEIPGVNVYNYPTKSKKKWFLNQKCKSADSEPDPMSGCIATVPTQGLAPSNYNYVQEQSTNLDSFNSRCNTYLKPTYLNNGDPVAGPSGLQRPSSINWEMGLNNRDSEFRSRSYSLTPTVNFAVFESESSSEAEDIPEVTVSESVDVPLNTEQQHNTKTLDDPFEMPMMSLGKVIPISPSAAQLSIASSYGDNGSPICKICHMTARENDPLISPCRCSGTMQYIHCGCLMRWLEVCHKRGRRPASCELCQYQYHWHKKFKIRHWQLPPCSRKDKILHFLFFLSVLLMITCASITVLCFKQDKGTKIDPDRTELTQSEIVTLVCGVLFFLAFFVAMYVEVKSHDTLYQLLVKFIHINQQWYIDEYEKKETAPVAV